MKNHGLGGVGALMSVTEYWSKNLANQSDENSLRDYDEKERVRMGE